MELKVYGGWHNDANIRMKSSSGGIFSALAEQIISLNGYVYGASLQINDGKISCHHVECSTTEELSLLRGSKYMFSELGDVFLRIKNRLQNHNWVLFCGTPCQVGGLLSYLGKKYDKLLTVDFICHGVPVPNLFEKVKIELEQEYKSPICSFEFRNKQRGWVDYSLRVEFKNGQVYSETGMNTNYMKLFFSDMYLKESCYNCQFKGIDRESDITLGDFWGVNKYHQIENEEIFQGVSVILCHSDKGRVLLERMNNHITLFESSKDIFDNSNIYIRTRANKPVDRFVFKNKLDIYPTDDLLRRIEKRKTIRSFCGKIKKKFAQNNIQKSFQWLPDIKHCYSCGACAVACPVKAIDMKKSEEGFMHPEINLNECKKCDLCKKVCPQKL